MRRVGRQVSTQSCSFAPVPLQHAEHDGKPYCRVPCYAALFGSSRRKVCEASKRQALGNSVGKYIGCVGAPKPPRTCGPLGYPFHNGCRVRNPFWGTRAFDLMASKGALKRVSWVGCWAPTLWSRRLLWSGGWGVEALVLLYL